MMYLSKKIIYESHSCLYIINNKILSLSLNIINIDVFHIKNCDEIIKTISYQRTTFYEKTN